MSSLAIAAIHRNEGQPRKHFDPDALEELAQSIRSYGLLEPIIVRPHEGGYQIIAGERRWRAAQDAGLTEIPAIIRDEDDATAFELSMIENVVRADMNPMEEAMGYRQLLDAGMTADDITAKLGKKSAVIDSRLRLLNLAEPLQALVASGQLDLWRAGQMTRISHEGQFRVMRALNAGQLPNVNDVDRLVSAILLQETQSDMFDIPAVTPAGQKAARDLTAHLEAAVKALAAASALLDDANADHAAVAAIADEAKRQAGRVAAKARTQRAQQLAAS